MIATFLLFAACRMGLTSDAPHAKFADLEEAENRYRHDDRHTSVDIRPSTITAGRIYDAVLHTNNPQLQVEDPVGVRKKLNAGIPPLAIVSRNPSWPPPRVFAWPRDCPVVAGSGYVDITRLSTLSDPLRLHACQSLAMLEYLAASIQKRLRDVAPEVASNLSMPTPPYDFEIDEESVLFSDWPNKVDSTCMLGTLALIETTVAAPGFTDVALQRLAVYSLDAVMGCFGHFLYDGYKGVTTIDLRNEFESALALYPIIQMKPILQDDGENLPKELFLRWAHLNIFPTQVKPSTIGIGHDRQFPAMHYLHDGYHTWEFAKATIEALLRAKALFDLGKGEGCNSRSHSRENPGSANLSLSLGGMSTVAEFQEAALPLLRSADMLRVFQEDRHRLWLPLSFYVEQNDTKHINVNHTNKVVVSNRRALRDSPRGGGSWVFLSDLLHETGGRPVSWAYMCELSRRGLIAPEQVGEITVYPSSGANRSFIMSSELYARGKPPKLEMQAISDECLGNDFDDPRDPTL